MSSTTAIAKTVLQNEGNGQLILLLFAALVLIQLQTGSADHDEKLICDFVRINCF